MGMQFRGEAVLPVITDCLTRILSPSCRMVPQSGTIRGVLIDSIAIGAFDQPFLRGAPMPINVRILHRRSAADGPALRRYDSVLYRRSKGYSECCDCSLSAHTVILMGAKGSPSSQSRCGWLVCLCVLA